MNTSEYKKLVKSLSPKEPRLKNAIIAFLVGGLVGLLNELMATFISITFFLSKTESYMWATLITILITVILTGLSKFDDLVSKCKCGLIIPTTGFAHSVASSSIDYKRDGLITGMGSNFFKLAGSVILYGIISSFLLIIIKVIIYG